MTQTLEPAPTSVVHRVHATIAPLDQEIEPFTVTTTSVHNRLVDGEGHRHDSKAVVEVESDQRRFRTIARWRRRRQDAAEADLSETIAWFQAVRDTEVADFALRTVRPERVSYQVPKRPTGAHRGRGRGDRVPSR